MASNTIPLHIVGNLTADPELRQTPSGATVANVSVASTPRIYDREAGEYKDGETTFLRGSIWRDPATNVGESLKKGDRVLVIGTLVSRSWETPEGEKRTVNEIQIDEIGPSLTFATAQVTKVNRREGNGGGGNAASNGGGQKAGSNGGAKAKAGASTGGGDDVF